MPGPSFVRWVEHTPTGRVGMVAGATKLKVLVQFGAGGPFERVWKRELKAASAEQIRHMEGR